MRLLSKRYLRCGVQLKSLLLGGGSKPVRFSPIPDQRLVLQEKVVGEELNIFRRVLDLVPLSLAPWPEIPVPIGPAAHITKGCEVGLKLTVGREALGAVTFGDCIHEEAKTYNPRSVH
jgi:hypothetical protein